MSYFHRLRFMVALCATLGAASCASPDPKLYLVAPVPGTELHGGPKVVALHSVGVAQVLAAQSHRAVIGGLSGCSDS